MSLIILYSGKVVANLSQTSLDRPVGQLKTILTLGESTWGHPWFNNSTSGAARLLADFFQVIHMLTFILCNIYLDAILHILNRLYILCKPALTTRLQVHKSTLVNAKEFDWALQQKHAFFFLIIIFFFKWTHIKKGMDQSSVSYPLVLPIGYNAKQTQNQMCWIMAKITITIILVHTDSVKIQYLYCMVLTVTHQLWELHALIGLLKKNICLKNKLTLYSFIPTSKVRK